MNDEQKQVTHNTINGPVTIIVVQVQETEISDNRITPWYETWWGKAALSVLVIVLAAALIYYFGLD